MKALPVNHAVQLVPPSVVHSAPMMAALKHVLLTAIHPAVRFVRILALLNVGGLAILHVLIPVTAETALVLAQVVVQEVVEVLVSKAVQVPVLLDAPVLALEVVVLVALIIALVLVLELLKAVVLTALQIVNQLQT